MKQTVLMALAVVMGAVFGCGSKQLKENLITIGVLSTTSMAVS